MKQRILLSACLTICVAGLNPNFALAANFSSVMGFVTPSELTIPLRSLCLASESGECTTIWSGTQDIVLKRSDANMANVELNSVSVPVGRYFGVTAAYAHGWSVKLNGNKYMGKTGTAITNAAQLWSTGTNAASANSVQTSTATATTMSGLDEVGVVSGAISGTSYSTSVAWGTPICVTLDATDSKGTCKTGDVRVTPDSTDTSTSGVSFKKATLSVVMDLTHSVAVDANNAALGLAGQYPYIDFGGISSLVHLAAADGTVGTATGYSEYTLAFDKDGAIRGIQYKFSDPQLAGNTIYGRGGGAMIEVTSAPTTVVIPSAVKQVFVASYTASTGQLKFPITGQTKSKGLVTLNNVKQAVNSSVAFSCDSTTTTLAGFTWTNDPAYSTCSNMASGSNPYTVVRIYDPNGVLGTCTSASTGYSSLTGTCSSTVSPYVSDTDGYL